MRFLNSNTDEISKEKRFELYIDTLNNATLQLLQADDETIKYSIFEEFDIGIISFLHDINLEFLVSENLISEDVKNLSQNLRQKALTLQQEDQWNLESLKTSPAWIELLTLSDEIKTRLLKT